MTNDTLSTNTTGYYGGGLYNAQYATATVNGDNFSGNSAPSAGGALDNLGQLTLDDVTSSNDSTPSDGGGLYNNGVASLTNDTFAGDSAGQQATYGEGGALFNAGGTTTLTDVTLSQDHGTLGEGV